MPENKHYLNRIVPQHKKPKFMKWLDANIQPFFDGEALLKDMDAAFDLDNSVGLQMNTTGGIVGRARVLSFDPADGSSPVLDDGTYRLLQRAKISMNQWDGTIPGIITLWENLFPEYTLIIQDNQDMTMDLYVIGFTTPPEQELMARGYIAPKPMGVLIRFTFIQIPEEKDVSTYFAAAPGVLIKQYIICGTTDLSADTADYHATAPSVLLEKYIICDGLPVADNAGDYAAAGTFQTIREVYRNE
jgi:hypothetical protein